MASISSCPENMNGTLGFYVLCILAHALGIYSRTPIHKYVSLIESGSGFSTSGLQNVVPAPPSAPNSLTLDANHLGGHYNEEEYAGPTEDPSLIAGGRTPELIDYAHQQQPPRPTQLREPAAALLPAISTPPSTFDHNLAPTTPFPLIDTPPDAQMTPFPEKGKHSGPLVGKEPESNHEAPQESTEELSEESTEGENTKASPHSNVKNPVEGNNDSAGADTANLARSPTALQKQLENDASGSSGSEQSHVKVSKDYDAFELPPTPDGGPVKVTVALRIMRSYAPDWLNQVTGYFVSFHFTRL